MNKFTDQRQKCQVLLAQLRQSQDMLKSQICDSSGLATGSSSYLPSLSDYTAGVSSLTSQSHPGILKTSSIGPRSYLASKSSSLDYNNSATVDYSTSRNGLNSLKSSGKSLPQGISNVSNSHGIYSDEAASSKDLFDVSSSRNNYDLDNTVTKTSSAGFTSLRSDVPPNTATSEMPNTVDTFTPTAQSQYTSTALSASPTRQNWREILDRHVTVPSQLSSQELRDLENQSSLNYSYSHTGDGDTATVNESFKRRALSADNNDQHPPARRVVKTTVCEDITNKPVSVSISDMPSRSESGARRSMSSRSVVDTSRGRGDESQAMQTSDKTSSKRVQFFKEQLEDEGNSRKFNNFIKDTTIRAKSSLNSTAYRSLCPSKQNTSDQDLSVEDQRLLGYDWIAALLDNDTGLADHSESFFNELKDFRRAFKSECSNQFYRESPHTLVEFESEPVVDALTETKVHPYIVNERLFTEPFKSGLIDYQDDEEVKGCGREKKTPTEDNPRFVRVSIPRSTLSTPYKVKPHRRRSFDGTDSCSLMDHCLLGWENSRPAMIPTAKSLDLNTEAGTRIDSQVTTLSEAERLAAKFSQADWPFSRPTARVNTLPTWRKHYMDTTLNLSMLSGLGAQPNASSTSNTMSASSGMGSNPGGGSRDVKRSTDQILRATYSAMYEMERVRKERELEMAAFKKN